MRRQTSLAIAGRLAFVSLAMVATVLSPAVTRADDGGQVPGTGSLRVEPNESGRGVVIRGRDARQQLVVTAVVGANQQIDVTRRVTYAVNPSTLAAIDSTGYMIPLADGEGQIAIESPGYPAVTIPLQVTGIAHPAPMNFTNQVVPVFTKLNCNGGGCHGKATGQNGFKLSLLGFQPEEDYEFLVKESRGRRLFPTSPATSLLLTKPTGQTPHGGGKKMEVGSYEYQIIYRWLEQGMPFGSDKDPKVVAIRCVPDSRVMTRRGEQQVTVEAVYSDGSVEDVTRTALFEPNDPEMADVSTGGLVRTLDLAGEVAIMARYQGQVATFRATIPLGAQFTQKPSIRNYVDDAVFSKLETLGIPASAVCDDATFLRRVSIDIAGMTPTADEVAAFLADTNPAKRDAAIDRLLDSRQYADLFANKWSMILRNKQRTTDAVAPTFALHNWVWESMYRNKPYDQFVRDLLTATGDAETTPTVGWYREVDQANEQVEDVSQLFLGMRIQCARCHHHPFEKWSQDDYYGMAAFFSRIGRKNLPSFNNQLRDRQLFHDDSQPAMARNDRSGKMLVPAGLGATPLQVPAEEDPRGYLVDWMTHKDNPYFAKAVVNRYWKHFFSRGIVEPEDDMRETNPPTNPVLLDSLAKNFIESGFDLKQLVRTICQSSTYQLTSLPNDYNGKDKQNFSRYYPKRLSAEVLYDAFHRSTNSFENFHYFPPGISAVQLVDPIRSTYFLKVFGQPPADTACECERSSEANLAQSLHLLNSTEVQNKLADGNSRPAKLAADTARDHRAKVSELYKWVYGREPDSTEVDLATAHIEKNKENPKVGYEDIMWALINTKEFLFNH
jgi:Protein of unknown function (DUF1549)/Protein of unknown function (DUF1553)